MSKNKKEGILPGLFASSQGDRMKGAQFIAKHNVSADDIAALTSAEIDDAFLRDKQAHKANGLDFITDRDEFERAVRFSLQDVLKLSPFFKK